MSADGMSSKFMKNAFVGWTFTAGLYYPPDFDATKLVPLKHLKPKGQPVPLMNIRMMFPFTMICDACGEYNYTGTKFTAKVEKIKGESFLGLHVYRFYGRCKHCWAEFTFKTDPKNSDYTMESGGKRTYEAWKDADMAEAQLKQESAEERERDAMKALEQKSVDVQAEMQRIEDLDAIRSLNKRNGSRDQSIEEALDFVFKQRELESRESDTSLASEDVGELGRFREAQERQRRKQLDDAIEAGEAGTRSSSAASSAAAAQGFGAPSNEKKIGPRSVAAKLAVKRKFDSDANDVQPQRRISLGEAGGTGEESSQRVGESTSSLAGLGAYESDSS